VTHKRPSKAKAACTLIDSALHNGELELFSSVVDETPHATIQVPGNDNISEHRETHPVKGGGFSKYIRRAFWESANEPLCGDALTAALAHAEMRALLGGSRELYARVAHLGDSVIVDAGDEAWGAYEITAAGWAYVNHHPVPFVRSHGTAQFPRATYGPRRTLVTLLKKVLLVDEETGRVLAAWAVCTYCGGPYLVLVLFGEQGSGKTTAVKVLRLLTDPSAVPLRTPPRESRDLVAASRANHIVAYDNLSSLPQWLSDALSMIATGGGYEARQLFTDYDEVLVRMRRPIILNGIENPAISADLLDRSLLVGMKPISKDVRRSEEEINADLEGLGGELTGAVFDAVSGALAEFATIGRPRWARMVDATRWALAAAKALGITAPDLESTLKKNRTRRDELVLEGSVFAAAVIEFITERGEWEGTTTQLKVILETETTTGEANATNKNVWPQTVQGVAAVFDREAPILRRQGIEWTDVGRCNGMRLKRLSYRAPEPEASE
jgi:hypothetical protein